MLNDREIFRGIFRPGFPVECGDSEVRGEIIAMILNTQPQMNPAVFRRCDLTPLQKLSVARLLHTKIYDNFLILKQINALFEADMCHL